MQRPPLLATLPMLALAACASPNASLERLQPRAAEAIDPRVPLPAALIAGPASAVVVAETARLVAQAEASTGRFDDLANAARGAAASAGARQSESWIVAQQALSQAVAARAPVTSALGALDALAAGLVEAKRLSEGDRLAIDAAARRVGEIDSAQANAIDAIQQRIGG